MADVKISALPAASTPLTGGEVLPIVQSGTTTKVAVSNLTAGLAGTASININGTVGATTPTTGAFTSGTFSTTLGVTGTSTLAAVNASGTLTLTKNNDSLSLVPTTATSGSFISLTNTGGTSYFGIENSSGGSLLTGAAAYGAVITSAGGRILYLGTGGANIGLSISGTAVTIPGTLGVTQNLGVGSYGDFTHREVNGGAQYIDAMRVVATNDGDATGIFILGKELAAGTQSGFLWFGGTNGTDQINLGGIGIAGNTTTPGAETGSMVIYTKPAAGAISTVANFSSTGAVTMPAQPAFLAFNSAVDSDVTGNGGVVTVDFDTEVFDQGGNFASDTFTAPVTGRYRFSTTVYLTGIVAATSISLTIMTSNRNYSVVYLAGTYTGDQEINGSALCDMDAADTATVRMIVGGMAGNTADIYGDTSSTLYTHFSGELVC